MSKSYLIPDDPQSQENKGDIFAYGKKKIRKDSPAYGSPYKNKTLIVSIVPFTNKYKTHGKLVDFEYKLSTINGRQFDLQNKVGSFEGDRVFESSMYKLKKRVDDGALAEKRAVIFSDNNTYSGYIRSANQTGKSLTITVEVKKKNPHLPEDIQPVSSVELGFLPKDYIKELGFNLQKEQKAYGTLLGEGLKIPKHRNIEKLANVKPSLPKRRSQPLIADFYSKPIREEDLKIFKREPFSTKLLIKYAPTKNIKKIINNIDKIKTSISIEFINKVLAGYKNKIAPIKNSQEAVCAPINNIVNKFDNIYIVNIRENDEFYYLFLLQR